MYVQIHSVSEIYSSVISLKLNMSILFKALDNEFAGPEVKCKSSINLKTLQKSSFQVPRFFQPLCLLNYFFRGSVVQRSEQSDRIETKRLKTHQGRRRCPARPRETPLRPRLARPAKIKSAVTGKNKGHTLESFQFRNPSWNKMTTLNIDYDYINDHDYEC